MTELKSKATILDGDRFEAVCTIVGQVAHDFNNLLTPLVAYPSMIKSDLPKGSHGAGLLDVVEKTAGDMAHITNQLLELTMRRNFEAHPLDLNSVVTRVISQIESQSFPETLEVEYNLETGLAPVQGAADRVATAIYNVCINGLEAMGTSGTLKIETRNVHEDHPRATQYGHLLAVGDYARLTVQDTGPGISPELRDKVFEPFVTTKKSAGRRGAGLGLSVTYRIVTDHGGYIDLESDPGKGTMFTLLFPVK